MELSQAALFNVEYASAATFRDVAKQNIGHNDREITYMQFLVARSLWMKLSLVRYSMPLAIWEHITVRRFFTSSTCSVARS